jgi:predicted CoA-binding protein
VVKFRSAQTTPEDNRVPDSIPYSEDYIAGILKECKTIAVVGMNSNPERWSHIVGRYLRNQGYTVIPVNPEETAVLGLKAYPDLASVPVPIDMVDIFRRVPFIPPHVDEAIAVGAKVVWMQDELIHEESAARARQAGITVVMDTCTARQHRNLKAAGKL